MRRPLTRAVFEGIASIAECQHAIGAAVLAMDPYRVDDDEDADYNGERTLVVSPPSTLKPLAGEGGARLISLFLWRITVALRDAFDKQDALPSHQPGQDLVAVRTRQEPALGPTPSFALLAGSVLPD